jgi:hypothetical protein
MAGMAIGGIVGGLLTALIVGLTAPLAPAREAGGAQPPFA